MVHDLSGEQRDNETRAARINNDNLTSVTRYLSFNQAKMLQLNRRIDDRQAERQNNFELQTFDET